MLFIEKIRTLSVSALTDGNAAYIDFPKEDPIRARHIVFSPMSEALADHLVASYKGNVPDPLMRLYRTMNGALLFRTMRYFAAARVSIPVCRFSIYGIPTANPQAGLEPFNIGIEDLNRRGNTPTSWLKFGSYYEPMDAANRRELYIDTKTCAVHAVDQSAKECSVLQQWPSLDACLCDIFDRLSAAAIP